MNFKNKENNCEKLIITSKSICLNQLEILKRLGVTHIKPPKNNQKIIFQS